MFPVVYSLPLIELNNDKDHPEPFALDQFGKTYFNSEIRKLGKVAEATLSDSFLTSTGIKIYYRIEWHKLSNNEARYLTMYKFPGLKRKTVARVVIAFEEDQLPPPEPDPEPPVTKPKHVEIKLLAPPAWFYLFLYCFPIYRSLTDKVFESLIKPIHSGLLNFIEENLASIAEESILIDGCKVAMSAIEKSSPFSDDSFLLAFWHEYININNMQLMGILSHLGKNAEFIHENGEILFDRKIKFFLILHILKAFYAKAEPLEFTSKDIVELMVVMNQLKSSKYAILSYQT